VICLCERVGRLAEPWVRPRRFGGRDQRRGGGRIRGHEEGGGGGKEFWDHSIRYSMDYKILYEPLSLLCMHYQYHLHSIRLLNYYYDTDI